MEHMPDQTEIVLQSIVADMQQLSARMDFFESVVLQLLMGLKEAGIIVDEEDEQEAEEEGTTEGTSRIILP
tara:strand:- start:44 stop:256 length:213 start_codon:yes stop_codon:yes gene_type:complete